MIKAVLEKSVKGALEKLGLPSSEVNFEHPSDLSNGDYSTNIALILATKKEGNTYNLAQKITTHLGVELPSGVEKVQAVRPGFINFYLKEDFFAESLKEATKKDFGKTGTLKNKKIILEYTDPNPFKVFHIGHLMTNTIGESLSRLAEFNGGDVKRVNYQGDVGLHIAKAIWGIMNTGEEIKTEEDLGKAYAYGAKNFEENIDVQKEVVETNKKIYSREDKKINDIYERGKKISLQAFEKIYKRLGTEFDKLFFESEVGDYGREIVENNANLFQKSGGAVVFKGENYGLHTRVFINSDGLPTYEAKELGLAKVKYDYFPYDESVIVTGNEINDYFKVLFRVMRLVYEKEGLADKTVHIGHGMLRLPEGKMSSRTGDAKPAMELLDEIKNLVLDVMSEREIENKTKVADMVAVAAFKYSVLKQSISRDIIFDFNKSISFEGDSGPYLQYTAVRAKAVLDIAKSKNLLPEEKQPAGWQTTEIEKLLYRFPETTMRAWEEKAPQLVSTYLIELVGAFNAFYAKERIAEEGKGYNIYLTEAVKNTLEKGLYLLGIEVPTKM